MSWILKDISCLSQITHLTKCQNAKELKESSSDEAVSAMNDTSANITSVVGSNETEALDITKRHPGKLFDLEGAITSSLIITEPITWSRLKIVYSFEYDGTSR